MSRRRSGAKATVAFLVIGWLTVTSTSSEGVRAGLVQAGSGASSEAPRAVIDQYCVRCHNQRLKTAGLALDVADAANVAKDAAIWEKVVRKLQAEAMPPAGSPRPDRATYDRVARYLETELDRAATARPNPGHVVAFHRLSRTEYTKAIRDLLALDALPRELDIATLLPADNSSTGFDNLADLLFVSPTSLDGYLAAARKISRLAVGDPAVPLIVDRHQIPSDLPQDVRQEGAPIGTRGGAILRSTLPVDGDYRLRIEFAGNAREPHQLEVSVDGARAALLTVGEKPPTERGFGVFTPPPDRPVEVPLTLRAGPHAIAVTYIQHTAALGEELVRPRLRGRGTLPALSLVTLSGPHAVSGSGDTPSRRRLFVCRPASPADEASCAREILSTLTRRAYRRRSTTADVQQLLPFYEAGRAEGGFDRGIQYALERVLVSPQFLFRIEREPAPGTIARISDVELASRLSFFLWSSIPDDPLLDAAVRGTLRDPTVLERQVRRMIADPRSEALVTNFAGQWLFLRDVDAKRPDERLFPDFDEGLRLAFKRETELFIDSILREDRSVLDLLTADYTFVNGRLAKHYRIPHVFGAEFRRVSLEDDYRRGLLGQGSILLLTSYSTRTSPVLRGKYVLANLLGTPPPPPPANVPALATEKQNGQPLSMRDAMVQHRANPTCASCHARMDPIGFALDNFDAVGRWRTVTEAGEPIDPSGELPDGARFEGVVGLRRHLLRRPTLFVSTLTENLLTYALGRTLEYYDGPLVRAITREAAGDEYRFSSLILGIVRSAAFQMRSGQAPSPSGSRPVG
jgi:mono/diheme cytochrome c family protein